MCLRFTDRSEHLSISFTTLYSGAFASIPSFELTPLRQEARDALLNRRITLSVLSQELIKLDDLAMPQRNEKASQLKRKLLALLDEDDAAEAGSSSATKKKKKCVNEGSVGWAVRVTLCMRCWAR